MNPFLNELAKQLAGKWVSLLVIPGALFVASVAVGWRLRFGGWPGDERLVTELQQGTASGGEMAAAVLGALLLSAWAGLLAQGSGRALHRLWLGQWPGRTGEALAGRRRRRWDRAQERYEQAYRQGQSDEALAQLAYRRNRIALAPPARPTHMGDNIAALSTRVRIEYGLDLEYGWPRLWLVLPEETRAVLDESRDAFDRSAALAGWGALYTCAGTVWWPLGLAGLGTLLTAIVRGRSAITNLAQLMESAVDLHGASLAASLGIPVPDSRVTPEIGREINRTVRKGA
ncbi:hypothetical protein AB0O76_14440 [Streptomyces sp. NPDC086554]|uniref:hypothetical protein n=1 Tax=Streptomyces sp. NPDC086554 TaxID=3154864 RepID=UPI0034408D76